eukprot:765417-Hanusia_phi.AAC.2
MATMKVMDKVSKINLVDLAESEWAAGTGETGDRLKEGAAINKSLSALGKSNSAFADTSEKKRKAGLRSFPRLHQLVTKRIFGRKFEDNHDRCLVPCRHNYEETLNTLRYADRAKQIKNTAIVNEDPNQKLIRELQEEVERLRKLAEKSKRG